MKILIIDDSPDARAVARTRLAPEGYQIICAESGSEGLALATRENPDLILLDLDMPVMSGFEVCRRLKADEAIGSIPVIFLTGSGDTEDKVKGLDLGAADYVAKPFDSFELRARVRSALRAKYLQDQLVRAERELRTLNESLEQQVAERTANVEALLRQKTDFIHQLGHDLKTPLTPLVGLLPLLEKRQVDPDAKRIVQLALENVAYMKRLVERTLRLAQLNVPGARVSAEEVDLHAETNRAVSMLSSMLTNAGITVDNRVPDGAIVWADPLDVQELMTNLLSNSVKYTRGEGRVTVDTQADGEMLSISVTDTGIGMTPQQVSHACEEFYKADESRHDLQATGLGLSICKRIVERHGGRIQIHSDGLRQGTTVHFTLPRIRRQASCLPDNARPVEQAGTRQCMETVP